MAAPPDAGTPSASPALRLLRLSLAFFAGASLLGGPWDFLWHLTVPFESFFSPPHLFIYSVIAVAAAGVAGLAASERLRKEFAGDIIRIPLFREGLPAPLVLLGGGIAVIFLSGALDDAWHTAYGLDETRWSLPHAMSGWGLFMTMLGFTSARLALSSRVPLSLADAVLHAFLLLAFSLYAFLLPFLVYTTPETLRAIAALPVVQAQPGALHTFRMYSAWGIDHSHPAFPILASLWAGAGLALLRRIDPRPRTLILATTAATGIATLLWYGLAAQLGTAADPASWLPLPILPAALVLLLLERTGQFTDRHAWAATAAVFASLTVLTAGRDALAFVLAFIAIPGMVLGAELGNAIGGLIVRPTGRALGRFLPAAGLLVPLLAGALDLYLRWSTP